MQKFFEDYVKKLEQLCPGKEIVFLVDALEQLRAYTFDYRTMRFIVRPE